jgi:hypothetical protein
MLWKKILFSLFTFFVVDVTRLRLEEASVSSLPVVSPEAIEDQRSERQKRQAERKKQRLYDKNKWKKRRDYRERTYKYQSTKSRDSRYSNQKSLRRMYRNS